MSNTEWKKGYEEGFTAGWRASKVELNYTNYPPVYYGGTGTVMGTPNPSVYNIPQSAVAPTGQYSGTMADSTTMTFSGTKTVFLSEDC